jgi:GNAT superfamily N-acetyltransferase
MSPLSENFTIAPTTQNQVQQTSHVLSEAVAWMTERNNSLWQANEVTPAAIEQDVFAGRYHQVSLKAGAVAVFKLDVADSTYWPESSPNDALYVHRIAVLRSHAGFGIPSLIINYAEQVALRLKIDRLRLDCQRSRTKLRHLYEGLGFTFHSNIDLTDYHGARYERILSLRPSSISS